MHQLNPFSKICTFQKVQNMKNEEHLEVAKPTTCNKICHCFVRRHRAFMTTQRTVIALFIIGLISLAAGTIFIIVTNNLTEYTLRYDDVCVKQIESSNSTDNSCIVTLNITNDLQGKLLFLFRVSGYYQNTRRIFESRSSDQLRGQYKTYSELSDCDPSISKDGSKDPSKLYLPCGLLSLSYFNDTYEFLNSTLESHFGQGNISVKTDRDELFKPLSSSYKQGIRWLEEITPKGQTDEHFIVWMRIAALPNFLKLYSRCEDCSISPGLYNVKIHMNYPRSMFDGNRYIVLANTSTLGGRSYFISVTYLVIGGLSLLCSFGFLMQLLCCPRKLGQVNEIFAGPVYKTPTLEQKLTMTALPRLIGNKIMTSTVAFNLDHHSSNLPSEIPISDDPETNEPHSTEKEVTPRQPNVMFDPAIPIQRARISLSKTQSARLTLYHRKPLVQLDLSNDSF